MQKLLGDGNFTSQSTTARQNAQMKTLVSVLLLCSATLALVCVNEKSHLVNQEPKMLLLNPGETAIINCTVTSNMEIQNMYLRKRFRMIMTIRGAKFEVLEEYNNRLTFSGTASNFILTLKNLTDDDSDFYICDGLVGDFEVVHGGGTLIFVEKPEAVKIENQQEQAKLPTYVIPTIIVAIACFLSFLGIFVYARYKILQEKKKKGNQSTYVDMTQTLRRNTMQSVNVYCHT